MFMENYLPLLHHMKLGWCEVVPIRCWFLGQGKQTRLGDSGTLILGNIHGLATSLLLHSVAHK